MRDTRPQRSAYPRAGPTSGMESLAEAMHELDRAEADVDTAEVRTQLHSSQVSFEEMLAAEVGERTDPDRAQGPVADYRLDREGASEGDDGE